MKTDDKYLELGRRIKESRDEVNMSQKELAEKLGFDSATAISLIESGDRRISVEQLEKVAQIFHKDIKFFLGQEEQKADIKVALRADKDLSAEDENQIMSFINFVKKQKDGK